MRTDNGDDGRASGIIGGVILLSLGAIFLLQSAGVLHAGHIWDYWPMLLVWAGLARMFSTSRRRHFAGGVLTFLIGVFFQLDRLGLAWFHARDFWPALLVFAGLALIAESLWFRRSRYGVDPRTEPRS